MATDATGTPTALGIPKYNTSSDPPSGKGFNAAMDAIDALIAARLASTAVATAGTTAFQIKLLTGDTQPSFKIFGNGTLNWGVGGSTAPDTDLFRLAANSLKTNGNFDVGGSGTVTGNWDVNGFLVGTSGIWGTRSSATAVAVAAYVTGDTVDRFQIQANGVHNWGPGNGAVDTNLYRFSAGTLRSDGSISAQHGFGVPNQTTAGDTILVTWFAGDTQDRFEIYTDGKMWWGGGGSVAVDTNLYRSAANILKTDDAFRSVLDINAQVDGAARVLIGDIGGATAGLQFGSTQDVNLYRASADNLKTDDALQVVGDLLAGWDGSQWVVQIDNAGSLGVTGSLGVSGTVTLGGDAAFSRSAANQIEMSSGDTFKVAAAGLKFNDNTTQTTAAQGAYKEITSATKTTDTSSTASTEGTAATVVTASAFTPDGTSSYRIEWGFPAYTNGNNVGNDFVLLIHDGSAVVAQVWKDNTPASTAQFGGNYGNYVYVPSNSSKTYSLRFFNTGGNNNTVKAGAGGAGNSSPAFIRVIKVS